MVDLKAPGLDALTFKASKHPKDVRDQVWRATEMVGRGDIEGALRSFDAALAQQHSDPELLEGKGLLLLMLDRPEEALALLDEAVNAGSDDPTVQVGRGVALHALGRLNESVAAFNQALALRPDENVLSMKRVVLEELLWSLVREGKAAWSGGKPKGSSKRVQLTPGPSISEMVHEGRR